MSENNGFDWLAARDDVQSPEVAELLGGMPQCPEAEVVGMCLYAPLKEIKPASRFEMLVVWGFLVVFSAAVLVVVVRLCVEGDAFTNQVVEDFFSYLQGVGDWFADRWQA